jgi:PAS domain S-box-containing protein
MTISHTFQVRSQPTAIRYALAVLAALVALLLREMPSLWFGANYHYLTVSAAVVFSSWYCGVGPSVVTTLITWLGTWYWFVPTVGSFALINPKAQVAGMVVFLFLSGFIIALGEANRRTKAILERSEFRFRRLIESNIIPVVCTNMERITEANDTFLNMVGYSRDDLDRGAISWESMTPSEYAPKDEHAVLQLQLTGSCTPFEKEYIRKDGSRVPILLGGATLNPSPLETLCFVVDLSDLKRAEAELRKAHHGLEYKVEERTQDLAKIVMTLESEVQVREKTEVQLRELSARLLRLQDEERRRVARDLHDSTGQTLTALKITLASLETLVACVPKAPSLLHDLNALADQALQEIRTTSYLLHPPLLDEAGFSSAARWYVEGFSKRSGIKTNVELPTLHLTKDAELVFFRVLQESLTNVLRHSESENVDIRSYSDDQNAVVSIRDYGRGIPSETLKRFNEAGTGIGVGLGGMRQRVAELSGQLRVECDGKGTCVTATVPLTKPEKVTRHHYREVAQAAPGAADLTRLLA